MKLRRMIKRMNQSRRMYRRFFQEAALIVHPTSRQKRNQLVTEAYNAGDTLAYYTRITIKGQNRVISKLNSRHAIMNTKQYHASKDTKFGITTSGIVVATNLLDHNFKPVIGMLILFPGSNRYRPTPIPITRDEITQITG